MILKHTLSDWIDFCMWNITDGFVIIVVKQSMSIVDIV
jgi:hypothetical protein